MHKCLFSLVENSVFFFPQKRPDFQTILSVLRSDELGKFGVAELSETLNASARNQINTKWSIESTVSTGTGTPSASLSPPSRVLVTLKLQVASMVRQFMPANFGA